MARKRRLRRYFKKTLILRQWQPTTIRPLRIRGWFPALLCSTKRTSNSYIYHMTDIPPKDAGFGGNISISNWNMEILYQESQMNRNRWSRNNADLDLVRYTGGSFRFYRDADRDYIAFYNLDSPMIVTQWSHLRSHPQLLLQRRKHILIPSLKTKRGGRRWITRRFLPPKLMRNQWYFQRHFCQVNLVQLTICGIDLRKPWLRGGAESPVVEFQVLQPLVYQNPSILPEETRNEFQKVWKAPYDMATNWRQLLKEVGEKKDEDLKDKPLSQVLSMLNSTINYDSLKKSFEKNRKPKLETLLENSAYKNLTNTTFKVDLDRIYGMYSYMLLDKGQRYDHLLDKAYVTVRYNPLKDAGKGNRVWLDPLTKKDLKFTPPPESAVL